MALSTVPEHPVDKSRPTDILRRRFRLVGPVSGGRRRCYTRRPHGVVPRQVARRETTRGAGRAGEGPGRARRRDRRRRRHASRRGCGDSRPRRVPAGRPDRARGPAHRRLRHAHQPAACHRRGGAGSARAHRRARREDIQLLPGPGGPGALHRDPGTHREPAPCGVPRRRRHGPGQRTDHPHL